MKAYYFGCWGESGHYLFAPGGRHAGRGIREEIPFEKIDGFLQPHWEHLHGYYIKPEVTPCRKFMERNGDDRFRTTDHQGESLIHFKDGWNILAMWDSSVDKRGACNSNFIFYDMGQEMTFEELVELATLHFPQVVGRFEFEIQLVDGC